MQKKRKMHTVPHRRRTPSFSSTLLDSIYRSIDDSRDGNEPALCNYRENTSASLVKKQSSCSMEKASSLKRAIMMEKWGEKQSNYSSAVRFNSASSSSDSSNGRTGIYSSSNSRRSKSVKFEPRNSDNKNNKQGKTKLKALEIYGELKKVKQPISPGGRITSFLNSIFNANAKKVKMCSNGGSVDANFRPKSKSTASSPTAFSRSCLSKTGNNNKYSNGNKRSVKFCPVSVIVDEHCRPCGQKCTYEEDPRLMSTSTVRKNLEFSSINEELKKQESDYLRSYQRKDIGKLDLRGLIEDYDDEDEDALSCSSSDLFELDHLIGIGRYREELPVYETTKLKNNQAIVNGFML